MKQLLYGLSLVCLCTLVMNSCSISPSVEWEEDVLIGRWQNSANPDEYYVYTTETTEDGTHQYGYTWDESDDVFEKDVLSERYGNGWFKWKIEKRDLIQIHLMENEGADIRKEYTITSLTENMLVYEETLKSGSKIKYTFKKVN